MTVRELMDQTGLQVVNLANPDVPIHGVYCGDLLSWVMAKAKTGNLWLTIMTNLNTLAVASLCEVSCLILTEGVTVDAEFLKTAAMKEINVAKTAESTYEFAARLSGIL